jgi:octaprenyl-diphosphate synthase
MLDLARFETVIAPVRGRMTAVARFLKALPDQHGLDFPGSRSILGYWFKKQGKLIRPALVLLSLSATGRRSDSVKAVRLAACCELVHSSSLIHDDVVDGDETRRGRPVLNKVFGNRTAVLTGDLLFTWSLDRLSAWFGPGILDIYLDSVNAMCKAEISSMRSAPRSLTSYEDYLSGKTASLMSAACHSAAVLSGANRKVRNALSQFGSSFGLAYQLLDDSRDSDAPKGFSTDYPSRVAQHCRTAVEALRPLHSGPARDSLESLAGLVQAAVRSKD